MEQFIQKAIDAVSWAMNHKEEIAVGYLATVGFISWVVKLTPTLKDDNIVLPIIKFLGKYIAVNKTVAEADRPK